MTDTTRRQTLRAGWRLAAGLASMSAPAAARALGAAPLAAASLPSPQVTFMSPEAAANALSRTPGDLYYANMGLLEIRARVNSPLAGMSLADARLAVRDYDAAAVLPFNDEERTAIRGVIERMHPLLAARAPLYARTPWSFIKLDDRAEGGMPHTRGPCIVMPGQVVDVYVKMHRQAGAAGTLDKSTHGRNLLVHEQTHVLERASPARFEPLFTEVFGFTRMTPAPTTAWLNAHVVANPDGPDLVWAFPLDKIGGTGWVMPDVTLPDVASPRMPQDFQSVGVEVVHGAAGWKVVADNGIPRCRDLDKIPGYGAHFPFPDEDFHPTEIAAVALSHWILQDVPDVDRRPLMPAIAAWARIALA